ncbi:MAG: hypothetical protein U5M51_00190 [Emticicia sp.]|nr:hypothetical protein [Emticicia sp.]
MKKQFENIDDLSRLKINSLHDDDVDINDKLIWGKIEEQLDKKTKVRVFGWLRLAAVACLILLIGSSIFMLNQPQKTVAIQKKVQNSPLEISPKNIKKKVLKFSQKPDNKIVINKKPKIGTIESKRLAINVELIQQPNPEIITSTAPTFKPIEVPLALLKFPTKTVTKMRVIHLSEYQSAAPEVFMKPKTFYLQYAQADIQQMIYDKTPVIPYTRSNIQN